MKNNSPKVYSLAASAAVGAVYAALTLILAPISYGPVQFRVSEALCVLPLFIPGTAWGLFVGCALANLLTGNIFDIVFGSLATLAAGLLTGYIGRKGRSLGLAALGCLMPVILNALVIGAVITEAYNGMSVFSNAGVFALNAAQVGLGEAGVMYIIGLPLARYLPKKRFFREFTEKALEK